MSDRSIERKQEADDGTVVLTPERHAIIDAFPESWKRCLREVSRGYRSKEIGRNLGFTPKTVDTYVTAAMSKLGVLERRQAGWLFAAYEGTPRSELLRSASLPQDTPATPDPDNPRRDRSIDWRSLFPIRQKGSAHNVIHPLARPVWVFVLALPLAILCIIIAIGGVQLYFGGLAYLSGIYARFK